MTPQLERSYRRLLRAYPSSWRSEHQAALLSTLDEAADIAQMRPTVREARSLIANGLRARVLASNLDRKSALAQGTLWGAMIFLSFSVTGIVQQIWFSRHPSGDTSYGPIEIENIVAAVLYVMMVLRPRRTLFGFTALAIPLACGAEWFRSLQRTDPPNHFQQAGLIAFALTGFCLGCTLLWATRSGTRLAVGRRLPWLLIPVLAGRLPAKPLEAVVVILCLLLMLFGVFGGARLDPRPPSAALTVVALFNLNLLIFRPLLTWSGPSEGFAPTAVLQLLQVSFALVVVLALAGTVVRRHARRIFST